MKSLSLAMAWMFVIHGGAALPIHAQQTPVNGLNLVVTDGEGAVTNAREHQTTHVAVRVEDDNHKPVAGATVLFALPTEGSTGVFANGTQTLIATTDSAGVAEVRAIRLNKVGGKLVIFASASYRGLTAHVDIHQTVEGVPGAQSKVGGSHTTLIVVLSVAAAAAGGGAYALLHKGNSSNSGSSGETGSSAAPIGLTPGSGFILGPH